VPYGSRDYSRKHQRRKNERRSMILPNIADHAMAKLDYRVLERRPELSGQTSTAR
jgi:hypothetical protein